MEEKNNSFKFVMGNFLIEVFYKERKKFTLVVKIEVSKISSNQGGNELKDVVDLKTLSDIVAENINVEVEDLKLSTLAKKVLKENGVD